MFLLDHVLLYFHHDTGLPKPPDRAGPVIGAAASEAAPPRPPKRPSEQLMPIGNPMAYESLADLRPMAEQMAAASPYEYPSVFLVIPEAKPSITGPYRMMQGLSRDPFSVHCLCEFQFKSDKGSMEIPLWHPVFHTTGPFSVHLFYPAEFVRRMGGAVKSTLLALKYGQIGATISGVPVPDVSSLIPADLFNMPGHAADSSKDSLPASDEDVVEAIQTKRLAAVSLRPSHMGVGQVDVLKAHFGQVQVSGWVFGMSMG